MWGNYGAYLEVGLTPLTLATVATGVLAPTPPLATEKIYLHRSRRNFPY